MAQLNITNYAITDATIDTIAEPETNEWNI